MNATFLGKSRRQAGSSCVLGLALVGHRREGLIAWERTFILERSAQHGCQLGSQSEPGWFAEVRMQSCFESFRQACMKRERGLG